MSEENIQTEDLMQDGVRVSTIADTLRQVRSSFLASAPEHLERIEVALQAWRSGDVSQAEVLAARCRALHATAGTIGYHSISRQAAKMETMAQLKETQDLEVVDVLFRSLKHHLACASIGGEDRSGHLRSLRANVLVVFEKGSYREGLNRGLESRGFSVLAFDEDREAAMVISPERTIDRVVLCPGDHSALIARLRATSVTPPLVIQLGTSATMVLPASRAQRPRGALMRSASIPGIPLELETVSDVLLDLNPSATDLAQQIADIKRPSTSRSRVLAVGSEPAVLASVRAVLEPADVEVASLSDGRDLLRTVDSFEPDLILLEMDMPKVDGLEVLAALRGEPRLRNVAVVFMTASGDVVSRIRAFELGADDVLEAPVDLRELRVRVLSRLSRSQMTRAILERDLATGLPSFHAFLRRLSRILKARAPTETVAVAILRTDDPKDLAGELPSRVMLQLRARDVIAALDDRTLGIVRTDATGSKTRTRLERLTKHIKLKNPVVVATDTTEMPDAGASAMLAALETRGLVAPDASAMPRATSMERSALVADPDPLMRGLVIRLLERDGFNVQGAADGAEAADAINAAIARKSPFALAVLDLHLPRRSGIELLGDLQSRSPSTAALVLSAQSRDADVARVLGAGAVDLIPKPFSAALFLARVQRVVGKATEPPS